MLTNYFNKSKMAAAFLSNLITGVNDVSTI
jgi:hypothetical protein